MYPLENPLENTHMNQNVKNNRKEIFFVFL